MTFKHVVEAASEDGANAEFATDGKKIDSINRYEVIQALVKRAGTVLTEYCHGISKESGWWKDIAGVDLAGPNLFQTPDDKSLEDVIPMKLLLIHTEISEATEGHRKGLMDDHLPHRSMIEVELADALIRIYDLAGALNLDIGGALVEKLIYNTRRADHKPEARAAEGGKKY